MYEILVNGFCDSDPKLVILLGRGSPEVDDIKISKFYSPIFYCSLSLYFYICILQIFCKALKRQCNPGNHHQHCIHGNHHQILIYFR